MPYEKQIIPMTRKRIDAAFEKMDRLSKGFVPCGLSFDDLLKELSNGS